MNHNKPGSRQTRFATCLAPILLRASLLSIFFYQSKRETTMKAFTIIVGLVQAFHTGLAVAEEGACQLVGTYVTRLFFRSQNGLTNRHNVAGLLLYQVSTWRSCLCSHLFLLGAKQLLRAPGSCWSGYLLISI